jgi:hypothetical protein
MTVAVDYRKAILSHRTVTAFRHSANCNFVPAS